jgi:hypothetical protein
MSANRRTRSLPVSARSTSAIALGLALVVPLAAFSPANASFAGAQSSCVVVNPNRYQCNFPTITTSTALHIEYVSMQCGSTGNDKFSLQEFQILTTPPGSTSEVGYQIPLQNQPSLGGVVTAGSPVTIYATERTSPRALIDLYPAPSGETQCTVSYSGIF